MDVKNVSGQFVVCGIRAFSAPFAAVTSANGFSSKNVNSDQSSVRTKNKKIDRTKFQRSKPTNGAQVKKTDVVDEDAEEDLSAITSASPRGGAVADLNKTTTVEEDAGMEDAVVKDVVVEDAVIRREGPALMATRSAKAQSDLLKGLGLVERLGAKAAKMQDVVTQDAEAEDTEAADQRDGPVLHIALRHDTDPAAAVAATGRSVDRPPPPAVVSKPPRRRSSIGGGGAASPTPMFDTEKFIGEIRKRPAIYDVRSKIYSNRVAKLKYWHEVGAEMYKGWDILDMLERRSIVKELQIKWKSIRDHFMRQLKQNMNGEGPRKKKYVHFDQLQFLTTNLGAKRPRHSHKQLKQEIVEEESEYMELTPELPQCERHFSSILSASSSYIDTSDFTDSREVPSASLPLDLTYHHQGGDDLYNQQQEYQPSEQSSTSTGMLYQQIDLSHHKEFVGDRMGNKLFLLSLLPIMERLTYHANIRARLQLMDVLHTFAAQEDDDDDSFQGHNILNRLNSQNGYQNGPFQLKSFASHSDSDT